MNITPRLNVPPVSGGACYLTFKKEMNKPLHLVLTVVFAAFMIGCAGSPMSLASLSPAQLENQSNASLAQGYGVIRDSEVRAELERRKVFTQQEWQLVDAKSVAVGMSELALIASQGLPGIYGGINTTVTASGATKQYVYRATTYHSPTYVYVDSGKVSAYQH
jgi:hypothetical protein